MHINRHNYESWFLRYVDQELMPAEQAEVDAFVLANPDLAEELDALLATRLDADLSSPAFPKKSMLYRQDSLAPTNEEAALMDWLDGESSEAGQISLQARLAEDPNLALEWERFQQTKLPNEIITFPNKASLYRREENRVVPMYWVRYAAAAVLLLLLGWGGWTILRNNPSQSGGALAKQPNSTSTNRSGSIANLSQSATSNTETPASSNDLTSVANARNSSDRFSTDLTSTSSTPTTSPSTDLVGSENISLDTRNLSATPNVSTTTPSTNNVVASVSGTESTNASSVVTATQTPTPTMEASYTALSDSPNGYSLNDDEFEEDDDRPRTKVGGLIRQVKRTITGNAQAGSSTNKGVRVAAFKIASH